MIKNTLLFGVFVLECKGELSFSLSKYKEIDNIKLLNMLLFQEDSFPLHTSNYLSIQYTYMKDLTEWFEYTYLKELSVL